MVARLCPSAAALLVALVFAAPAAAANDYFVAKGGAGSACSAAQPCLAIATAIGKAADGDTIHIGPGTYTPQIDTTKQLTFIGAGAGTLASTNPATDTFVDIPGNGQGMAMILRGGGTVRSMRIRGQSYNGSNVGGSALVLAPNAGPDGLVYTVKDVVSIGGNGLESGAGISVSEANAPTRVFTATVSTSTLSAKTNAIYVGADNANVNVADSELDGSLKLAGVGTATIQRVHGNNSAVIYGGSMIINNSRFDASPNSALSVVSLGGTASATVRDSVFASANTSPFQPATPIGVAVVEAGTNAGDDAVLTSYGSTFYGTGARWHAALLGYRYSTRVGDVGIKLVNTILRRAGADGSTTSDILGLTDNSDPAGGTVTIDASHSSFTTTRTSGLATAPASGSGTNITGDPLFASAPIDTLAGADFRLQGTSPLIDMGDPAAVTDGELDYAGNGRSLDGNSDCTFAPDVGAYERQTIRCPEPNNPGPTPEVPGVPDTVKPVVSKLSVVKRIARFTLSEAAGVTLIVERAKPGRRVGKRCLPHRKRGKRCTRWVRVRRLSALNKAGANVVSLGNLSPGRYRVRMFAVDAAKNQSKRVTRRFRVTKPRSTAAAR